MLKKKGFTLSITFLVTLIITMTIFSMGIYMIKEFFSATQDIEAQITADIQKEVERRLMESGDRVAIPLNKATIDQGKAKAFGLGILNTLGETSNFYVKMEMADPGHYTLDGDIVEGSFADSDYINNNWIFSEMGDYRLENNAQKVIPITVSVDKRMSQDTKTTQGTTFVFNVCVATSPINFACQSGAQQNLYTNRIYKIYVDVR